MTRELIDKLQAEHDLAQWNARRVLLLEEQRAIEAQRHHDRLHATRERFHRRLQLARLCAGIGGAIMMAMGWWLRGAL